MVYQDRDDAQHPFDSPDYYEWWYFDADFDNGYTALAALLWRWTDKDHQPGIDIAIYAPDGKSYNDYKTLKPSECRASTDWCNVMLAGSFCRQEGPDIYHVVAGDAKLGLDLIFHRTVPGWKLTPTGLMIDTPAAKQGWINAVPRAHAEGWLLINNERLPVKGTGYHDHNWGNIDMGKSFAGWVWGRAFDKVYTFVYGWLMPLEPGVEPSPFIYATRDKQPVFAGDLKMKLLSRAKHPESGKTYPTDLELSGKAPWGTELKCRLTMEKLLAWDKGEQASGKPINYYRRLSRLTAEITVEGKTEHAAGNAMDEYTSLE
jgi:predicted secreted hydrolase